MAASATISGSSSFRPAADPDTGNVDHLALAGTADFAATTDTVAQIRIDADDGVSADAQTVTLALMRVGGTFTSAFATDIFTRAGHGLVDNNHVRVSSSGTLPAGLTANTPYYIRDSTTNTFKLAATPGGTAINITSDGTGTHSLQYYGEPEPVYTYPTTGPTVPVTIKTNRDGGVNDFTTIKGFHVRLVPKVKEATVMGTFTADIATDVITTSAAHKRSVGSRIQFTNSGGGLPDGLTAGVDYYVLTVPTATTMTVSAASGGTVVNIGTVGTGTHSWQHQGDAYGEVWVTLGDSTVPMNFVSVPLKLVYTAGSSNAESLWVGSLPSGVPYNTAFHLTVSINDSTPRASENLSILVNLLGN